jgi:hypothetical protein
MSVSSEQIWMRVSLRAGNTDAERAVVKCATSTGPSTILAEVDTAGLWTNITKRSRFAVKIQQPEASQVY